MDQLNQVEEEIDSSRATQYSICGSR